MVTAIFISIVFLVSFWLYYASISGDTKVLKQNNNHTAFYVMLILGAIVRIIFAATSKGYEVDISTFKAWGNYATTLGLNNLYFTDFFLDYPPGYMYVLYLVDTLRKLFGLAYESMAYTFILKLPAMIFDLLISIMVYKLSVKRMGNAMAVFLSALILFNPAVIVNSAVWGQIDSVFTFFILASLMKLYDYKGEKKPFYRDNIFQAAILYGIAVLIKPQALIFGPVYLFFVIQTKDWRVWVRSVATGLLTVLIICLPFTKSLDFSWLIERYINTFASYPYVSVYAFNVYAFFGQTWAPIETVALAGIPMTVVSWIMIGLVMAYAGVLFFKAKDKSKLTFLAFFITAGLFTLGAKMHERYFFPGLIFLFITYILRRDKRFLYLFAGYSAVHFYNVYYVLDAVDKSFDPFDAHIIVGSLLMVALFAFALYLSYDLYWKNKEVVPESKITIKASAKPNNKKKNEFNYQKTEGKVRLVKADYIVLAIIMLLYSVVSFYRLGSLECPVSSWQPARDEQSVTFDLGEAKAVDTFLYMAGIGKQEFPSDFRTAVDFGLEYSNDGVNWYQAGEFSDGYVFEWKKKPVAIEGRYIRLNANTHIMAINEVAFLEAGKNEPVALKVLEDENYTDEYDADRLIDEQSTVPVNPTNYDGTYFDEIYHARTAYEQLLGEEAYESTHPPLGKIIISIGIAIFGMNPFGWRVMGVIFGILMLPAFYILLKKMFKASFWAGIGTFIFVTDFMHYVQSRISTIDTYAVFFVILMYVFMYQYWTKSFYDTELKKTLLPLGLCGLCMSLGIASKWTVAYGAVGLAIIFFISLGRRFLEYLHALKQVELKKATEFEIEIADSFKKKTGLTILFCVGCFILLPILIYILSYIPYFMSGHRFSELGQYIVNMFNYHAGLVDTHPFSSAWWQWPIMTKPVWYFASDPLCMNVDKVISIVNVGNPAIWWISLLSMIATAVVGYKNKDKRAGFIIIGYVSVYLIQALVPRILFIYHYYTAVPFLILSLVYILQSIKNKKLAIGYCAICFALFVMFFPVLSGMPTTQSYIDTYLKWLPGWYF